MEVITGSTALSQQQIEEQTKLEREAIRLGLERLHKQTYNVESKDYASASIYGSASINTLIPLVIERIKDTGNRIHEGKTGRSFVEIQQYLSDIEPLAAAAITCKMIFDKVFSYRDESSKVVNIADSIGTALEQECQMRYYEREVPGLLKHVKDKYWHTSCGTGQKFTTVRTMMNRKGVHWQTWGRINRVKLGGWLLDCVCSSSGWFEKQIIQRGRKKQTHIVPSALFMDMKDEIMANAAMFSPIAMPMLVPPKDWSQSEPGGYLLNEVMRGHDMVRRGDGGCIQGEQPIEFLNKIQKVGYSLNEFTVSVAESLAELGYKVGKFIPIIDYPLPPKPVDIATNKDSRKEYRRRAAEAMNKNAASFKQSCRTRMTLDMVRRFRDKDVFYIPWSFDYRGRAYPIPAFLTPQDTDFGKSLIKFHKQAFMTHEAEDWLRFQVATTYGLDKATMSDRIQWVKDNTEMIAKIASDPMEHIHLWESADEPWQFLAACDEYYHCVLICDRNYTNLPVATDATCSGLQILAGLCRDKSTAKLVNVLPSESPQDAYKVVAEHAAPNCPESIRPLMDRRITKKIVMTLPYNSKPYSNRIYVREALKEKGIEIQKDDLTATVNAVRASMDVIVPGPMRVMKWIESEVAKAIKRGEETIQWVTPSGFVVTQRLMKKEKQTVKLQLLGRCEMEVATGDSDKVDLAHHKNATAPNLIHSLDASLLHLSVLRFDAPIALIHDSVLCRATDMSLLSTNVRQTYMYLFAEHDYLEDFAQQIGAETEPPLIGDLEPESVIHSTYFFC